MTPGGSEVETPSQDCRLTYSFASLSATQAGAGRVRVSRLCYADFTAGDTETRAEISNKNTKLRKLDCLPMRDEYKDNGREEYAKIFD